ncbi:LCP family protein [Lysinibacillus fusiformis]|nr:LCP family protein [Lysinibacillus fusiformis]
MIRIMLHFLILVSVFLLSSCQQDPIDQSGKQAESLLNKYERLNPSDFFKNKLMEKPLHFLVVGVDSRGEKESRADSIMIVQYSAEDRTVKVVSVMRDSYVEIPGYKQTYGKINLSYFLGGEKLLKETIQNNFGVNIDYTITVDFHGFASVIDTIVPEGMNVEVSAEMIEDMKFEMEAGENTLHGEELLKYVRFRHDDQSDFGRVNRQQEILLELKNKINEKINSINGVTQLPDLVDTVIKNIKTDLSVGQVFTLSSNLFLQPIEDIKTMRIPVTNGYSNKHDPHEGAVLEINFPKNQEMLSEFFSDTMPVNEQN